MIHTKLLILYLSWRQERVTSECTMDHVNFELMEIFIHVFYALVLHFQFTKKDCILRSVATPLLVVAH